MVKGKHSIGREFQSPAVQGKEELTQTSLASLVFRASNYELRKVKESNCADMAKETVLTVTQCYFKQAIYCNIYQHLTKRITLFSYHKNKQLMSGKDRSQQNFKTF